jgi:hypothetical protein
MADDDPEVKKSKEREELDQRVPEIPEQMRSIFASFFGQRPVFPPFMEKINEEHITKVLDYSDKEDQRAFENERSDRRYDFARLAVFCIVFLVVFLFLTVYVADKDKELYKDIIKVGLGLIAGLVGGYGYGLRKGQRESD